MCIADDVQMALERPSLTPQRQCESGLSTYHQVSLPNHSQYCCPLYVLQDFTLIAPAPYIKSKGAVLQPISTFSSLSSLTTSPSSSKDTTSTPMHLLAIPADVLIMVMHYLSVKELASLTGTCKSLHDIVGASVSTLSLLIADLDDRLKSSVGVST